MKVELIDLPLLSNVKSRAKGTKAATKCRMLTAQPTVLQQSSRILDSQSTVYSFLKLISVS